jgi:transposase
MALRIKGPTGLVMLRQWCAWGQRCRIPAFVELGRRIRRHWAGIAATMDTDCPTA